MTNDRFDQIDVTGRWVGFYRHRSEQAGSFPIIAEIRQNGQRMTGEMYDQITDRSNQLDEFLEKYRDDITSYQKHRLEKALKHFGKESVVSSHLPDTSDIDGTITGNLVRFKKTYRGNVKAAFTVGEQTVRTKQHRGHSVYYSGELDGENMCIRGEWFIRTKGLLGHFLPPAARGTFQLYQKS
jgi:hypothetical protein